MSDVIVHVSVGDNQTESKFFAAIDAFARQRFGVKNTHSDEAPDIMVKTIHSGQSIRKAITFQDRETASDFLNFWRRQ
ncbi:hypothetical protein [Ponticaulis koreensis]|uniref:hypothetical protein n=1 Tax=Ponticaulis koreensis TaxID=1123045 RepID=UPI0003B2E875|nr:hypothetical protein [Ponticaulis koreensis]